MFSKILVGHDLHEGGEDALALARALGRATGAELVAAKVFPLELVPHGAGAEWREREAHALAEFMRAADATDVETDVYPSTSSARGLYELAEETGADLIVIGSSRRGGFEQVLVGNVGFRLLHGSRCPVAVAPRGFCKRAADLESITVGYDASDDARIALAGAFELASATRTPVSIVAVAPPAPVMYGNGPGPRQGWHELDEAIAEHVRERVDEARAFAPADAVVDARMVTGDPAAVLAESADSDGGILVLGSRGYGPLKRVLLGSVSAELVRSARSPVLVFPRGNDAKPEPTNVVGASVHAAD